MIALGTAEGLSY
ncbi:hypothetical protein RDI58_028120 [Solanum bulbocastanum]|uniref:Uncharacterized protein n=2 Tax=Pentapetalae TaxID=1437201 RepID=A0AAN8SSA3_SOLBU